MAKLLNTEVESERILNSNMVYKVAFMGLLSGIFFWFVVALIDYYVNSLNLSSNLTSILAMVFGLILMVRIRTEHALIIAVATTICLWGLGLWIDGLLWWEMLLSSAVLFMLSFVVMYWITRIKNISIALLVAALVIILTRLTINM